MPKATPESAATEAEAVVLEYMQAQNRPYAATDVYLNLRGKVAKAVVIRVLGTLSTRGDLTKKEYGKSVLFVIKQSSLAVLQDTKLHELKEATKANKELLEELQRKNKKVTSGLNAVLATPTDAEIPEQVAMAQAKRDALRAQVEEKQAQLRDLPSLTQEQAHNLDQSLSFWRKAWVARRTAEAELVGLIYDAGSNAGGELQEKARDLVEDLSLPPDEAEEAEHRFKLGH